MPVTLANTITADMGLIPGLAVISPLLGWPLSLMAAIIERPFVTAAGVRQNAIWYSIQANVVSLLAGYLLLILLFLLAGLVQDAALAIWPFVAVFASAWIERRYLDWKHGALWQGGALWRGISFGWILMGNVISAVVCVLLLFIVQALDQPEIKDALRPYQLGLMIVLGTICAGAVAAAFIVPRRRANVPEVTESLTSSSPA